MESHIQWLIDLFKTSNGLRGKITLSIISILILWLIHFFLSRSIEKRVKDPGIHYQWKRSLKYLAVFVGAPILGFIWFEGFKAIANFLGLLSAGLAIALRELIVNGAVVSFVVFLISSTDANHRIE